MYTSSKEQQGELAHPYEDTVGAYTILEEAIAAVPKAF
jgi:hypothetical protein